MSLLAMFKSAGPTGFGYGSTAEQVTEGLSLASQTILVTGCMRIAHTHADRLFAVVSQGGVCHRMFDSAWSEAQNQMEYPFALGDALAYKFGFRGGTPLRRTRPMPASSVFLNLVCWTAQAAGCL